MVVDSDHGLQNLFRTFFRRSGADCVSVTTGREALEAARERPLDLIFMDSHPPDTHPSKLYTDIKAIHPNVPIIVITAKPESQTLEALLGTGQVTVITKPIEFNLLTHLVSREGTPFARAS